MDRWVLRNRKDVETASRTASHLAVQYPADLAWSGVICHVLDAKTLQQKQVRQQACAQSPAAGASLRSPSTVGSAAERVGLLPRRSCTHPGAMLLLGSAWRCWGLAEQVSLA